LKSTFVTVFEPIGASAPLKRVGRVEAPAETVVLVLETVDGTEHLVLNLRPGTDQQVHLADGRLLRTNGLAVRATGPSLILAGGTYAEVDGRRVQQSRCAGTIRGAVRQPSQGARGWFETDAAVPDPGTLEGRALLIHHGDGSARGWTIVRASAMPEGRTRFYVREEPGFSLDPKTGAAQYYQFPRASIPGPHQFWVAKVTRL
jgi:hypothetical protein